MGGIKNGVKRIQDYFVNVKGRVKTSIRNYIEKTYIYNFINSNYSNILKSVLLVLLLLAIIDYLDLPSRIIFSGKPSLIFICVISSFFIIIFFNVNTYFKLSSINYIDKYLFSFFVGLSVYILFLLLMQYRFASLLSMIALLINSIIILSRLIIYRTENKSTIDFSSNLLNIGEFLSLEDEHPEFYFFEENSVSYDFIGRSNIVNEIYSTIRFIKPNNSFVMSLTGSWGSGKTTVINLVKKKIDDNNTNKTEEKIIVIDFNPWKYNNDTEILFNLLDSIMEKIGLKIKSINIKRAIWSITSSIPDNYSFLNIGSTFGDEKSYFTSLKKIANDYIKKENIKPVLIVDNLERANAENILTVINYITNYFDFDNTIYLLAYDEDEMKKVFTDKLQINYDYLEKIVQMEYKLPLDSQNVRKLNERVLTAFFKYYNTEENYDVDEQVITAISENITDIRQLKRSLNSFANYVLSFNNGLNKIDAFILTFIRELNSDLYMEIYNNPKYYISQNDNEIYFSAEEYNKEATKYFRDLLNNNNYVGYHSLLSYLFPNVEKTIRSVGNSDILFKSTGLNYSFRDNLYDESIQMNRLHNGKYFGLYFSYTENDLFLDVDRHIRKLINNINNIKTESDILILQQGYLEMINDFGNVYQETFLEHLQVYLSDVKDYQIMLDLLILGLRYYSENRSHVFTVTARSRVTYLFSKIIVLMSTKEVKDYLEYSLKDIKDLTFLRSVTESLDSKYDGKDKSYDLFNDRYNSLRSIVINNTVNIFDPSHYSRRILWCFYEEDSYLEEIGHMIDESNVLYLLLDLIRTSIGSDGYSYWIDVVAFNKITTKKKVRSYLNKKLGDDVSNNKLNIIFKKFELSNSIEESDIRIDLDEPINLEKEVY